MACQNAVYQWTTEVTTHLPHLSKPQATVLALWSLGMVLARSCALSAVASWLAAWLGRKENTVRQQLREFCYEARAKRGSRRQALVVENCFAPLLAWVLRGWEGSQLALALDATPVGPRFVVLAISVVYRGCAIPGGLGGTAGGTQAGLETGMVAVAAALTACPAAREARDCVGRSGLVGPLAVSPDRAPGLASVLADQQ